MCGRAACTLSPEDLKRIFGLSKYDGEEKHRISHNICPCTYQPVIMKDADSNNYAVAMLWGLIPKFSKTYKSVKHPINARSETVNTLPIFKRLLKNNRCIVVANGYYEWKETPSGKQPYYIFPSKDLKIKKDPESFPDDILCMAGLYDEWLNPETGEQVKSYCIMTVESIGKTRKVHTRMPVILEYHEVNKWLDHNTPVEEALKLLKGYESLDNYKVSNLVSKPKNDGEECIKPIKDDKRGLITSYFTPIKKIKEENDANLK